MVASRGVVRDMVAVARAQEVVVVVRTADCR